MRPGAPAGDSAAPPWRPGARTDHRAALPDPTDRLRALDAILDASAWLWRPQPFKEVRPDWCGRLPALADHLLSLAEEDVERLSRDQHGLIRRLALEVPELSALEPLIRLPRAARHRLDDRGPHFDWGIPGRKRAQIQAFAEAVGPLQAPGLEWCGGKGHLGRLLALQWGLPVTTLEHDPRLCAEGTALARRARASQGFRAGDARGAEAAGLLRGRHPVALHACGDLHRTLLDRACAARAPALHLVPCCYHLGISGTYEPFSSEARLRLAQDELRLAVTETVTCAGREVRLRDREMAWKLGFDLLRRELTGEDRYRPLRPVDKGWLGLGFAGFCRALARREGLRLRGAPPWPRLEAHGWRRRAEVMRLGLVRQGFRRALELWLVSDLAAGLERRGYRVDLSELCPAAVTPRNCLISARLSPPESTLQGRLHRSACSSP
ncbi:MAG: methyltransferase [Chromatiales bacterium]|jgi:hypothetical protein